MSAQPTRSSAPDDAGLHAALAAALAAKRVRPERTAALRRSVLERVRQSAHDHRSFFTVRHEDQPWVQADTGVQQQFISQAGDLRSDAWQLDPGAKLPSMSGSAAQEVLVLQGTLRTRLPGAAAQEWSTLHHTLRTGAGAQDCALTAGPLGARVYTRNLQVEPDQLPAREAAWWTTGLAASSHAGGRAPAWTPFLEGVDAALLHGVDDVVSMLIRLAPGTTLPNHGHSLDEDCFMLEGHMFLGDILMRAGDYQRAPVGCEHANISSDTGGLFYFHGALPPAASDVQT